MKKVVGYCRVSTEEQVKNTSLEVQEKRIRAFCESQDWDLMGIFKEDASGKSFERKEFKAMLDVVQTVDSLDLILVFKLDRLSRSLKDVLIFVEDYLEPAGVALKSVVEPFDTATPEGKLFFEMLGSFAEFERKRIRERVISGKRAKNQKGGWGGGTVPYGYKAVNKELKPDPVEFDVAKLIRRLRKEKVTFQNIKDELERRSIRTRNGYKWSFSSLYQICNNPIYDGYVGYAGEKVRGKHLAIN